MDFNLDFAKAGGLVPAVVQDAHNKTVLMVGFMNQEALDKTQAEGKVTFFSRTKNRLWTKGETSGNFLIVKDIKVDCDNDTLLISAEPVGPVCHTGEETCFGNSPKGNVQFLEYLEEVIEQRKQADPGSSYTRKLFDKGINKIAQKVGEEAVELVIEAKDNNDDLFLNEAADLMFHTLILLNKKGFRLADVVKILEGRHK
ncbi:MAG: hypothetical protein RIS47_1307 [Bacteroidota bacterium]|jgi:phosphoribosyl-ATP pyrophosphohydrolase/phosphoribosyl-AMP cyclohydrolase